MKLFVTGITGHTGRFFTKKLMDERARDIALSCLVREQSDTMLLELSGLPYETHIGDLTKLDTIVNAMQGCDMVLHTASIYQSGHVIEAAKRCGIRDIILVHTTGRFSKYKSASAEYIKIEDGILADNPDLNICILRPTMIYGTSRDRNMVKLVDFLYRHRFFPVFGKGGNLMQPVHARDLGEAYYAVIRNWENCRGKQYNLPGKAPLAYAELIRTVAAALGRKVILVHIPIRLSILAAKVYNRVFGRRAIISVEQVMRMMEDKDFSYDDASRDFGYAPMGFEEGIRGEVAEYLEAKRK